MATQWPEKRAPHVLVATPWPLIEACTSPAKVCVVWRSRSSLELSAHFIAIIFQKGCWGCNRKVAKKDITTLGIGCQWMIFTGAQFLDGVRCLWPGWLAASLQWLSGPSNGHPGMIIVLLSMSLYPYHALLFVLLPALMFEYIYDVTNYYSKHILPWLDLKLCNNTWYIQFQLM